MAGDRYVNDILSSLDDVNVLFEAIKDMENTLSHFGFSIKCIITNAHWYYRMKNQVVTNGATEDGLFKSGETTENCFHHNYNWMTDELSIAIDLNTYPKSRGRSIGPSLEDTDVNSVIVTKETVARLAGQCYQLNGSIDVLVIAMKIFFSQVCNWWILGRPLWKSKNSCLSFEHS